MGNIRRTGKINSSHSTATQTATEVVSAAAKLTEVTKISLGIIEHIHGGRRSLKFLPMTGGIIAKIRGSGAIQEVYIYTTNPSATQQTLTKGFE
jgi:hypothetical protein